MPQIDLGNGFYYKQDYGIYCIDFELEAARLVISEQELEALTKWQEYSRTIASTSKNIESTIRKEYAGGVVITLDDGRKLYDKCDIQYVYAEKGMLYSNNVKAPLCHVISVERIEKNDNG